MSNCLTINKFKTRTTEIPCRQVQVNHSQFFQEGLLEEKKKAVNLRNPY